LGGAGGAVLKNVVKCGKVQEAKVHIAVPFFSGVRQNARRSVLRSRGRRAVRFVGSLMFPNKGASELIKHQVWSASS
jgi:hypothetical protein